MNKKVLLILSILLISLTLNASRIKRAYKALDIYNYFQAKTLFEKTKKRHSVPASYGLSIIYQRKDNPFYNIDSAYNNIIIACENYSDLKIKKKIKYKKFGVDSSKIILQRNLISHDLFDRAIEVNSVYGFQDFISKNLWSKDVQTAIFYRDSLMFYQMHEIGKAENYMQFLNTYPKSMFSSRATQLYDKSYYVEETQSDQLISYV